MGERVSEVLLEFAGHCEAMTLSILISSGAWTTLKLADLEEEAELSWLLAHSSLCSSR